MKILFVAGGMPFSPISEWKKIEENNRLSHTGFSLEEYEKVKGLEIIPEFEQMLINSRKNLGIPKNGLSFDEYKKIFYQGMEFDDKLVKKQKDFKIKINKEIKEILSRFECDEFVKLQLKNILLGNVVLPSNHHPNIDGDIDFEIKMFEDQREDKIGMVSINISSPIKKDKLIKFIGKSWKNFEKTISNLPSKKIFKLSEKEMKIIEKRDNFKLSFSKVADNIIDEFSIDNRNGKTNDGSVKTRYTRAKEKLRSLFCLKVTEN